MVLHPLSQKCRCGHDLRKISSKTSSKKISAYQRLSKFGERTLSLDFIPWSHAQLHEILLQLTHSTPYRLGRKYREILQDFYHIPTSLLSDKITLTSEISDLKLRLYSHPCEFRGEEYSAFFAALDLVPEDIEEMINSRCTVSPVRNQSPARYRIQSNDLEAAKDALAIFLQRYPHENPTQLRRHNQHAYYLLRLKAPKIFNLPPYIKPLPSIEADRETITNLFAHKESNLEKKYRHSAAFTRAKIRDEEWIYKYLEIISTQKHSLRTKKSDRAETRKASIKIDHERKIVNAINTILRTERRPQKLTHIRIANQAALLRYSVDKSLKNNQNLSNFLKKANQDKDRRMAIWAAQVLNISEQELTPNNILLVGGLVTTAKNRLFAISAIDLVGKGFNRSVIHESFLTDEAQRTRIRASGMNLD